VSTPTGSSRRGRAGDRPSIVIGVGIDPAALADTFGGDKALRRVTHEELLDDLTLHGTLVFSSQAELDSFVAAVKALPPSLSARWDALLSERRLVVDTLDTPADPALEHALDAGELEQAISGPVRLVLLERDHAALLGVPEDAYAAMAPGGRLEMGRLATGVRTAALRGASELLDTPLRAGENREVVWATRFDPLVAVTRTVTIYDKYAGMQAARRYVLDRPHADGLSYVMRRIAMRPGRRVRLITAVTDDTRRGILDERTIVPAMRLLMQSLADHDIRLHLVLVPERGGSGDRFGHDRHVRFDERMALALGPGLQTFSRSTLVETVTVGSLPISDAKTREASAERAQIRPPAGGWLGQPKG
jgi:hypothetical protein